MLGRDTTVALFMRDVMRDMKITASDALYVERFQLIADASKTTQNLFADVLAQEYMDESIIVSDTTGRYYSSAATWVAATSTLNATMNTDFSPTDVGKLVTFRIGSAIYAGYVATYVSATSVTVTGDSLPASNQTVDYVLLVSTPPSGDEISLANLRILLLGTQVNVVLFSSQTDVVEAISLDAYRRWLTASFGNKNSIVWTLVGERILLKKGSSVTTYGTMTLRYPRIAIEPTANGDYVDVPEGAPMEIAKILVKRTMADRLNLPLKQYVPNYEEQVRSYVQAIYRGYAGEIQKSTIEDRVKALS